jgi:uncharacterized lipoprotein YmbA
MRNRLHRLKTLAGTGFMASLTASLALALIAGCASAPKERFYTLNVVPPAAAGAGTNAAAVTISLSSLTLPDLYDRPQFVVREDANRVDIKEEHRWAQSLRLEVARVLTADLGTRLPNATLLNADMRPAPAAGPDYRVGVNIEQFDAMPGQAVVVQAAWSIRGNGTAAAVNGRSSQREVVDGPGYDALAAAYSRALGTISNDIATRLASLPRNPR